MGALLTVRGRGVEAHLPEQSLTPTTPRPPPPSCRTRANASCPAPRRTGSAWTGSGLPPEQQRSPCAATLRRQMPTCAAVCSLVCCRLLQPSLACRLRQTSPGTARHTRRPSRAPLRRTSGARLARGARRAHARPLPGHRILAGGRAGHAVPQRAGQDSPARAEKRQSHRRSRRRRERNDRHRGPPKGHAWGAAQAGPGPTRPRPGRWRVILVCRTPPRETRTRVCA